ncbi:hypothetical protein N8I77_010042 [Diaporthe amygdali]|uniref:Uncharacterized protein n=1 Tax=Phomopsis amygdali TaxID=1214568 RepID=A0AAD9S6B8_PHOAM|nr:hypothetical protein N8I77_010042 [Diaporthe amygdali]
MEWSRFEDVDISDPYKYSETIVHSPLFQPLWTKWKANLDVPYYGITSDGRKKEGLYQLQDEGAPTQQMVTKGSASYFFKVRMLRLRKTAAARKVISNLSASEREVALHDLDTENCICATCYSGLQIRELSSIRRKWCNPEFLLFECGLRLEHLDENKVSSIMELLRRSLSEHGWSKIRGAMKTNKFLGEICSRQAILNERSYFFTIFGEPSESRPWAYMLFGHHLCLNVFIARQQMVIGPVFLGAEPNVIDHGPDQGIELCTEESRLGLQLMQSLPTHLQRVAQVYSEMWEPSMPEDRWNPADQRHLAGAFQDNRVIPYEGVVATDMTAEQQELLMSIITAFLTLLPPKPLTFRLDQVRKNLSETFFSWIGGFGSADPFYYRIQSPVALFEFDHHSGVFLTNDEPAKYHIHTIQRLPNGNDYGQTSWSPGNCFENDMGSEPQDFGNVLSQLGIGVPSNFWEMDRTAFTDMPEIDASFVNIGENPTNNSQALDIGPLNDQTSVSPHKSPSSRSSGSLTNGKVSSIESLTRRADNAGALHGSEPPAIYIRKNETAGHYVG